MVCKPALIVDQSFFITFLIIILYVNLHLYSKEFNLKWSCMRWSRSPYTPIVKSGSVAEISLPVKSSCSVENKDKDIQVLVKGLVPNGAMNLQVTCSIESQIVCS